MMTEASEPVEVFDKVENAVNLSTSETTISSWETQVWSIVVIFHFMS